MREIIFFETDFGNKPVEEFLAQLDSAPRAKVVRTLELVHEQQIVPGKTGRKHVHASVPEQTPGHQPGRQHDDLGDRVIDDRCQGEELEGAESLDVVILRDPGQVVVEPDNDAQRGHHAGSRHGGSG